MRVGVFLRQEVAVFAFLLFVVFFLLAVAQSFGAEALTHSSIPPLQEPERQANQAGIQADIAKLPISFIANAGQADASVRFMVKAGKHTVFFTPQEVVFAASDKTEDEDTRSSVVRLRFSGANGEVRVEGEKPLPGVANFFLGNDSENWRTNVATYAAITYHGLYPGIDLIYSGKQGRLKSEFVVAVGADPRVITMDYSGASSIYVREDGALVLETPIGELVEAPPLIYQIIDEERVIVDGGYRLLGDGGVTFTLGEYVPTEPLIIDPVLVYSTYLGGSNSDVGSGIVVDGSGNVYITGGTYSNDFPVQDPLQPNRDGEYDVVVAKLNTSGSALVYSTYLGGSRFDVSRDITLDNLGNAYITGNTDSTNFPTQNPLQSDFDGARDAFVVKLNASGSRLVYSTYLGGGGYDDGCGITVDNLGNTYLTGDTTSVDFPTQNPLQSDFGGSRDAFVVKLNASGSGLVYSTYLGGGGYDDGCDITVDDLGNTYLTGDTTSVDFPTQNPLQPNSGGSFDVFMAKVDASGAALVYSTYLGGSGSDAGCGIAVDNLGNAYITGNTESTNFPTQNPLQPNFGGGGDGSMVKPNDAFVAKLNPSGSGFVYSTYLGGSGDDWGWGIEVDDSGNAYITGYTESTNFPTQNPLQSDFGGARDAFVAKVDASGAALVYSTYLGGSGSDTGWGIAVDNLGNTYLTGDTKSVDFPTQNPLQPNSSGNIDAFVAKIGSSTANEPPIANAGPDQTVTDTDGNGSENVTLDGSGSNDPDGDIVSWVWTENGNQIATGETPTVTLPVGTHTIILTVTDADGATDTDDVVIAVEPLLCITSPLRIVREAVSSSFCSNTVGGPCFSDIPGLPYFSGDTLTATFTIKNQGTTPVTLGKLVVGGRFNDGQLPNGNYPDFSSIGPITIAPQASYDYEGTLQLSNLGDYHFFCAYELPDGHWNTAITLGEGLTDDDRTTDVSVRYSLAAYIGSNPSLELVNLSDVSKRLEIYEIVRTVLAADEAKSELFGNGHSDLLDRTETLLRQIHPDPEIHESNLDVHDVMGDYLLEDGTALALDVVEEGVGKILMNIGPAVGNGWLYLSGLYFKTTADFLEMIGVHSIDHYYLGDIRSATVIWPNLGRLDITWFLPKNRIIVNVYLAGYDKKGGLVISTNKWRDVYEAISMENACSTLPVYSSVEEPFHEYLEDHILNQVQFIQMHSPAELQVFDGQGNATGLSDGVVHDDIAGVIYVPEIQLIVARTEAGGLTYEAAGTTDDGLYSLRARSIEDGTYTPFEAVDMPIGEVSLHSYDIDWDALSQGEEGANIMIDEDGDGSPEILLDVGESLEAKDTETGDNTRISFLEGSVGLEFDVVVESGNTFVSTTESVPSVAGQQGIDFLSPFYQFTSTADYAGDITVEISYDDSSLTEHEEEALRLFKIADDGTAIDITTGLDTEQNTITGVTDSFSSFAVGIVRSMTTHLTSAGWHMITLPGELCGACAAGGSGDLICALSDDIDPCYIFYYDPTVGGYVMAPPAENIRYHAGMGFWVRTYADNVTIDADVQVPTEAVEVSLGNGWNQIGNPFPFAVSGADLRVRCGDTELSLLDAQAQGWVSAYLFGYDTASGGYVMLAPTTGCLQPWNGYWMRSYRDNCELIVPPTVCSSASATGQAFTVKELEARGIEVPPSPPALKLMSEDVVKGLTVYNIPNPIRSRHTTTFKVEGKGAELVQAIRVEIYDQAGQRVFTQDINAKELEWHTDNEAGELLANGVYLYQVWVKVAATWYPTGVHKLAVLR